MKDHRQGNDLAVLWSILKDGEPFDLRGRSLKLYLKNLHERKEVEDFSVTGNKIHWTFYGKDQDTLGKHSLILVVNEDKKGMITTDACDFVRLVSCSCKLHGGEDAPNVETESIELTTTLEYVAGSGQGGDYDDTALWRALDGKVDKVEGLGLSEENYTTEEKEKLSGLENYDDTGIKKDISDLKAKDTEQDTKLAKLSSEVGGLSERIDNLPIAESSVFEAVHGVTTYDEIKAANDEGKIVVARYENSIYRLSVLKAYEAVLFASEGNNSYTLKCSNKSVWSGAAITNTHSLKTLDNGNVQVTIAGKSAEVATPQYVQSLIVSTLNTEV